MGISSSDNEQDKTLASHDQRINRLEKDVDSVLRATSENTSAITELRLTSSNLVESTKALLDISGTTREGVMQVRTDIKWIRIIGGAIAGAMITVTVAVLLGAIKV